MPKPFKDKITKDKKKEIKDVERQLKFVQQRIAQCKSDIHNSISAEVLIDYLKQEQNLLKRERKLNKELIELQY